MIRKYIKTGTRMTVGKERTEMKNESITTNKTINATSEEYLIDTFDLAEAGIYDVFEDENDIRRSIAGVAANTKVNDVAGYQYLIRHTIQLIKNHCDWCNCNKEIEFGSPEHLRTYVKVEETLRFLGEYVVLPTELEEEILNPFIMYPRVEWCIQLIHRREWNLDYPLFYSLEQFYQTMNSAQTVPEAVKEKLQTVLDVVNPWFDRIRNYGYLDKRKGGIVTDFTNRMMLQHYRSLSAKEVWEYGGGVCWDDSRFLCEALREKFPDMPVTNYIIYVYKKEEDRVGMNHSYVVLEIAKGYYLNIEFAYKGYKGIFLARSPYVFAISFAGPIAGRYVEENYAQLRTYENPTETGLAMDDFLDEITGDKYSKPVEFPYYQDDTFPDGKKLLWVIRREE